MRLSKFTFLIKISKNCYVLYNTINSALILVDEEAYKLLYKGEFSRIPPELLSQLKDAGIIVDETFDELSLFEYIYSRNRFWGETLNFTILPTYDCNFMCKYCYEKSVGNFRKDYMTEEIARETVDYIKRKLDYFNNVVNSVRIVLYGGEPLLNFKAVDIIHSGIRNLCQEFNKNYKLSIITNGSLLTDRIINHLGLQFIDKIQITLDGPPKVHDQRRPLKGNKGSFQLIWNNLLKIVDLLPLGSIIIRCNIDYENINSLPLLIDLLDEQGLKHKVGFYVAPTQTPEPCQYLVKKDYIELIFKALKILVDKNIVHYYNLAWGCTSSRSLFSEIIDPRGFLYKCWGLVGLDDQIVGSIFSGKNQLYVKYIGYNPLRYDKCQNCSILPFCIGGCHYENYVVLGDPFKPFCGVVFGPETLKYVLKLRLIARHRDSIKGCIRDIRDILNSS